MSNQHINQLENFTITENGEVVTEPLAIKVAVAAGNVAVSALWAISRPVGRVIGEMATHLQLDIADARYGTSMRAEYIEHRKQLATAALRDEMGL